MRLFVTAIDARPVSGSGAKREREGDDEAGAGERAMVYSRFLELPSLGSAPRGLLHRTAALANPLDPVTASLEAKWLGVSTLVLNATAEAKRAGVTTPHPYAENSICFVEPMVSARVAREGDDTPAFGADATPRRGPPNRTCPVFAFSNQTRNTRWSRDEFHES